jgi:hypothetical protein
LLDFVRWFFRAGFLKGVHKKLFGDWGIFRHPKLDPKDVPKWRILENILFGAF